VTSSLVRAYRTESAIRLLLSRCDSLPPSLCCEARRGYFPCCVRHPGTSSRHSFFFCFEASRFNSSRIGETRHNIFHKIPLVQMSPTPLTQNTPDPNVLNTSYTKHPWSKCPQDLLQKKTPDPNVQHLFHKTLFTPRSILAYRTCKIISFEAYLLSCVI
jgi:hypothetical protein